MIKTKLISTAPKASQVMAPAYGFPLFTMLFLASPLHILLAESCSLEMSLEITSARQSPLITPLSLTLD